MYKVTSEFRMLVGIGERGEREFAFTYRDLRDFGMVLGVLTDTESLEALAAGRRTVALLPVKKHLIWAPPAALLKVCSDGTEPRVAVFVVTAVAGDGHLFQTVEGLGEEALGMSFEAYQKRWAAANPGNPWGSTENYDLLLLEVVRADDGEPLRAPDDPTMIREGNETWLPWPNGPRWEPL